MPGWKNEPAWEGENMIGTENVWLEMSQSTAVPRCASGAETPE